MVRGRGVSGRAGGWGRVWVGRREECPSGSEGGVSWRAGGRGVPGRAGGGVSSRARRRGRVWAGRKEEVCTGGPEGGGVSGRAGGRGMPQQGVHLLGCSLFLVFPPQLQQLGLCGL